jgi:dTDP-4-amino-4,6-dideoxygalactose transaminase
MSVAGVCTSQLAIEGGPPVRKQAFAPWPKFGDAEIKAASQVLSSGRVNYWTGDQGRQFEPEFAQSVGCKHGIALANGSVALELALIALGIGPGDEVIVPSRSFIASASCVVIRGATPIFADADRDSQNLTNESIRNVVSKRTKAIIAVHLAGWPCDMDSILALADQHGFKVIEDCAQAQGSRFKGRPAGSFGDVAAFSFCQDKIMTTCGEGGMLTTNDSTLWAKAWSFKDHGKDYAAMCDIRGSATFRWVHHSFGTNWRMTEIQAAVGRAVLPRVPEMIARRQLLSQLLTTHFSQIPCLRVVEPPSEIDHARYKYYVFVRPDCLRNDWDRDRILSAINAEGVPCFAGSCSEIYLEKAFAGMRPTNRLPVARELGETSLMFLVHPTLCEEDMYDTCLAVTKVMQVASR